MHVRSVRLFACLAVVVGTFAAPSAGANWPNWRGPNFNGSSPETGLPTSWSRSEGVVWSAPMPGPGDATPVVWGDRVFVSSTERSTRALVGMCLSAESGKVLWRHRLGTDVRAPRNTMASPSPATDGRLVVFLYGTGEMAAVDLDGRILWRKNLTEEFGRLAIKYGYSSSPILFGGRLYVQVLRRPWAYPYNPGRPTEAERRRALDSFLLALEPATGKTLWRHVRPTEAVDESFESYGTPVPLTVDGRTDLVVSGGDCVTGHDPETGEERWRWAYNLLHENMQRLIPSPTPGSEGRIFVPMPRGSSMVALAPKGRTAHLLWTHPGPTTDSATPLFYRGRLYVLDSDRKDLCVLDPATGAELARVRLGGAVWRASPTGADGKVYLMSAEGEVAVLSAEPPCEVLARIDMDGRQARSSVVVAGGRLYIRTDRRLWCVGR